MTYCITWFLQMLLQRAFKKMIKLTIERSSIRPDNDKEIAIPYPTYYHPSSDSQIQNIVDGISQGSQRNSLVTMAAGQRRPSVNSMRFKLMNQCENDPRCTLLLCEGNEASPGLLDGVNTNILWIHVWYENSYGSTFRFTTASLLGQTPCELCTGLIILTLVLCNYTIFLCGRTVHSSYLFLAGFKSTFTSEANRENPQYVLQQPCNSPGCNAPVPVLPPATRWQPHSQIVLWCHARRLHPCDFLQGRSVDTICPPSSQWRRKLLRLHSGMPI